MAVIDGLNVALKMDVKKRTAQITSNAVLLRKGILFRGSVGRGGGAMVVRCGAQGGAMVVRCAVYQSILRCKGNVRNWGRTQKRPSLVFQLLKVRWSEAFELCLRWSGRTFCKRTRHRKHRLLGKECGEATSS